MPHPLEPLVALQKKDRKLMRLVREIHDIPKRKEEVESHLAGARKKLEEAIESRQRIELSIKETDLEIESSKEQIVKYKNQQMDAQNNEQYRAFIKEIGTVEGSIQQFEDDEVRMMESLEAVKVNVADCEAALAEEQENIAEEIEMLDERLEELKERAEELKAGRRRAAEAVDKNLLRKYSRIMQNKRDFAIVEVDADHCGGCHMKLPPQVIHDARNPTKLVACNFCGRMLYSHID